MGSSKQSSFESELQYDEELEALKQELNDFKKRNLNNSRRSKSHHEQLLSVLNISDDGIAGEELEKCAETAMNKYHCMKVKKQRKKLADPYEEEWNGLDPSNYAWFDDVSEGKCYDDCLMSLRERRMQYLVVMAIENQYCSIFDLTDHQNELLLLHQKS